MGVWRFLPLLFWCWIVTFLIFFGRIVSRVEGFSLLKWNDLQVNSFLLRCVGSVVPSTGVLGGVMTRKIFCSSELIPPWWLFSTARTRYVTLSIKNGKAVTGVTFYVPRDWLKSNQLQDAISTSDVPPHARAFFKQTDFPFDTNDVTRYLDCWRNRLLVSNSMWRSTYEDGHPMRDSTHAGTQNSPSLTLPIYTEQPPKLHET